MFLRRVLVRVAVYYGIACLVLAVALGELAFHPFRVPIEWRQQAEITAHRFKATLQDVAIPAQDGAQLRAWFVRPAGGNGNAAILLHGIGDNRQGMLTYAELLLSNGYGILLPDSRAQGESHGAFATYGIREADDVRRWFEWLENADHPRCTYGLGESMGAAILLQSLKAEPHFCAVVAESPFANFREVGYVRVGQFLRVGPWLGRILLRPAVELAFLYGRLRYGVDLTRASPGRAVENVRVPILLIHGLDDHNIPPSHSREIQSHNPSDITLWEVPRAQHCGAIAVAPEEFGRRVLEWFRRDSVISAPARPPT
ncbi:MAG TPA: alpha/beta hydrolase [Terracidiphilus sp.]|nr:alpha/beta hydrolase [Terracidiphilus sp.]